MFQRPKCFFEKADAMHLSVSPTASSLCLATVVWNPHTSSGTSMISEAGFVRTTDCSRVFTTTHRL